jgi:hypothetical protein
MDISNSVKVVHFLPGRVRLKVAGAKRNPAYAGHLREAFLAVPGIRSIEVDSLTGSVLIHYDSERLLAQDGMSTLGQVLQEQFPQFDGDEVLHWLKSAHL